MLDDFGQWLIHFKNLGTFQDFMIAGIFLDIQHESYVLQEDFYI